MNADRNTPIGQKDKVLQRMVKEQYLVKIRDTSTGEEQIEYMVGPRGKTEIGEEGAGGLVRAVYGNSVEDLEKRLDRSLGLSAARQAAKNSEADATNTNATAIQQQKGRPKQGRPGHQRDEDEDEDEESSEEDD
jgi:DNA-binding PadR family transcriptional regulator